MKILQIPKGIKKDEIYRFLPYNKKIELGGFVFKRKIYCYTGDERSCWYLPEEDLEKELTFHTHPLDCLPMPSIPDIPKILAGYTNKHILITSVSAIFMDIPQDIPKTQILKALTTSWKRKNDGEFKKRVLQRYILDTKGVQLKITDKSWIKNWQEILEKYIGIKVKLIPYQPLT